MLLQRRRLVTLSPRTLLREERLKDTSRRRRRRRGTSPSRRSRRRQGTGTESGDRAGGSSVKFVATPETQDNN